MLATGLTLTIFNLITGAGFRGGASFLVAIGGMTWGFTRFASPDLTTRVLAWGLLTGTIGTATMHGGLVSPAWIGVPLSVLLASLVLGKRDAMAILAASLLLIAGVLALHLAGVRFVVDERPLIPAFVIGAATVISFIFGIRMAAAIGRQFRENAAAHAELAGLNEELTNRETRLRLAASAAQFGIVEWRFDERRAYFSDDASDVLGLGVHPLPERAARLLSLVAEDDREALLRSIVDAASPTGSGQVDIDFRIRRPDGEIRWAHLKGRVHFPQAERSGAACRPTRFIGILTDQTEARLMQAKVEYLAYHDSLTSLPNRRSGMERLGKMLEAARGRRQAVAVLCIDIDEFKRINNAHGEAVGDAVLRVIAGRLSHRAGRHDVVFRLGGDAFVVAMSTFGSLSQLSNAAGQLLQHLSAPFEVEGHRIAISARAGIAVHPQDGETPDVLVSNASTALRHSDDSAHGVTRFFEGWMSRDLAAFFEIREALRAGLERREFELHYQPRVDLRTGHPVGAEALLRWRRPGHGVCSPGEFIGVAEESGLIIPLGAWVLREACEEAAAWGPLNGRLPEVSVNVSAAQFRQSGLDQEVMLTLHDSGLPSARLELELTESLLLADEEETRDTLARWRSHGVRLALDDFGTGYASMSYLARFDIDVLKIDQSFIRTMEPGNRQSVLCEAIVLMAHKLGLKVVAEGIETPRQLAFLIGIGCDFGQGYLISKPLPAAALREFFDDTGGARHRAQWIAQYALALQDMSVSANPPAHSMRAGPRDSTEILIVDDDPTSVVLLKHLLRRAGYQRITATSDPRDAESAFVARRPDLVLLDVLMPGMDGFAVLARIRANDPERRCAVVMITGDLSLETSARARATGVDDLVHRPFDPDQVMLRIANALELRALRQRNPAPGQGDPALSRSR